MNENTQSSVTDIRQLTALESADSPELNKFIRERALDAFVDKDWNIWFRRFAHSQDPSFRLALQELRWKIRALPGNGDVSSAIHGIDSAVWSSFKSELAEREIESNSDDNPSEPAAGHAMDAESNELVDELLDSMIDLNASDLHVKTGRESTETTVRMRINGILVPTNHWNYQTGDALLRALWNSHDRIARVECGTNNGSFYHRHAATGKKYMVRMTEAPEIRGTMFVARIRDPEEVRKLNATGYTQQQQQVIQSLLSLRSGLISINGPTNSGKSSTQTSMLALMPRDMHIIEIGDPVETHLDHVAHFELSESHPGGKERHLKELLGSTVRQDPDMLALTEMRDELTAKAAMQLASQGKLVITTMHTFDFVTAFERLRRFGMSADDIVSPGFLRGFVSQRLLPKLCSHCALTEPPDLKIAYRWIAAFGPQAPLTKIRYRNKSGCPKCNHTGVAARVLVAEAVQIDPKTLVIARKIIFDSDPAAWHEHAHNSNILNIHQHAALRVLAGEVDPIATERDLGAFSRLNLLRLWGQYNEKGQPCWTQSTEATP